MDTLVPSQESDHINRASALESPSVDPGPYFRMGMWEWFGGQKSWELGLGGAQGFK